MMARTVIDVDDKALALAATALGTKTKVATVNAALREVAARNERVEAIMEILELTEDLSDPEVMSGS